SLAPSARRHFVAYSSVDVPADGAGFFFSSRRRHTRWPRDWSSDVCSSDLTIRRVTAESDAFSEVRGPAELFCPVELFPSRLNKRSEERRVGKSVDLGGRRSTKKKRTRKSSDGCGENCAADRSVVMEVRDGR